MKEVIHQNVDKIVTQGIHSNDGLPRTFEIDVWMDTLQNWNTSFSSKLDLTGGTLTGQLNTTDVKVGGNLEVTGDVTFLGNVTTISTETIELADNILLLNSNATTDEDGGIEVSRGGGGIPNVSFKWDSTLQKWTSGLQEIQAAGFSGNLTGNATSADTWSAARNLAITGAVTGNVSLDGSADVTLTTSLTAHNHSISEVSEISILTPADGQVLTYDTSGANPVWVNKNLPAAPGPPDLDQLGQVNLPAPNDLDVLQYDLAAAEWQAKPLPATPTLGQLTNTNLDEVNGSTHNAFLAYNSTAAKWEAKMVTDVISLGISISAMSDVDPAMTPAAGEVLTYVSDFDGSGNPGWKSQTLPASAVTMSALTDVDSALAPADHEVLTFLSGQWISQAPQAVATDLKALTDVENTLAPSDGDYLVYRPSGWTAEAFTLPSVGQLSDLSDVQSYDPNTLSGNEILQFDSGLGVWKPMTPAVPSGSAATLDDLTGVTTVNKADDYVLTYDSTLNSGAGGWEPRAQLQGTTINGLNDIGDVTIAGTPSDGEALVFRSGFWGAEAQVATVINKLGDVSDVTLNAGIADGDVLVYNAGAWESQTPNSSGNVGMLDDLTDVSAAAPTSGQLLEFDGLQWKAKSPPAVATIAATVSTTPQVNADGDTEWDFSSTATGSTTVVQSVLANGDLQYQF